MTLSTLPPTVGRGRIGNDANTFRVSTETALSTDIGTSFRHSLPWPKWPAGQPYHGAKPSTRYRTLAVTRGIQNHRCHRWRSWHLPQKMDVWGRFETVPGGSWIYLRCFLWSCNLHKASGSRAREIYCCKYNYLRSFVYSLMFSWSYLIFSLV